MSEWIICAVVVALVFFVGMVFCVCKPNRFNSFGKPVAGFGENLSEEYTKALKAGEKNFAITQEAEKQSMKALAQEVEDSSGERKEMGPIKPASKEQGSTFQDAQEKERERMRKAAALKRGGPQFRWNQKDPSIVDRFEDQEDMREEEELTYAKEKEKMKALATHLRKGRLQQVVSNKHTRNVGIRTEPCIDPSKVDLGILQSTVQADLKALGTKCRTQTGYTLQKPNWEELQEVGTSWRPDWADQ
jgi:hypothetical protein